LQNTYLVKSNAFSIIRETKILKYAKDLEVLYQKSIQMNNKLINSTLLIREMQIKTHMGYHCNFLNENIQSWQTCQATYIAGENAK
jgi:hypothetical protein